MTILNLTTKSNGLFLADTGRGIARYDIVNHPEIEKITKNMREFYWIQNKVVDQFLFFYLSAQTQHWKMLLVFGVIQRWFTQNHIPTSLEPYIMTHQ